MKMTSLPDIPYQPVGAVLPNLDGLEYRTDQDTPAIGCPSSPPGHWRKCSRWLRQFYPSFANQGMSRFPALPTEILVLIVSELPDASRASLALTCTRLLDIVSESKPFEAIALPAEQPSDFQSPRMSRAQVYHPARWEFLRSLERDLKGKWLLCSECFTLLPRRMFTEYKRSVVPWLKSYYASHDSDYRSCRPGRTQPDGENRIAWAPSGIVDLCPCIKLTMSKKRLIEASLRESAQPSGHKHPAANFWWHECRHTYGDVEIEMRIGLFLYDGTETAKWRIRHWSNTTKIYAFTPEMGELGAIIEYRHTYPSRSQSSAPRLLCPHRNLHIAIQDSLRCRETHTEPGTVCLSCKNLQYCEQCRTKVLDLLKNEDTSTGMISCFYRVERCLDGRSWPMHTVFPFARRQIPLQRQSPWPIDRGYLVTPAAITEGVRIGDHRYIPTLYQAAPLVVLCCFLSGLFVKWLWQSVLVHADISTLNTATLVVTLCQFSFSPLVERLWGLVLVHQPAARNPDHDRQLQELTARLEILEAMEAVQEKQIEQLMAACCVVRAPIAR